MASLNLSEHPHRRLNPLTREWVLVSPHRTQRPWLGQVEELSTETQPAYDPGCYMCPGNTRAGGIRNPEYLTTLVFDNDYPALLPDTPAGSFDQKGLLVARGEPGLCRVACFSRRHDLTLARMSPAEIRLVVDLWTAQYQELGSRSSVNYVQIFENRGAMMGASNPHPHCQIWANASLPNVPERELSSFESYSDEKQSCLLCDYLRLELSKNERVVCQNEGFAVVVPYWAVWPFETLLVSKRHLGTMHELASDEHDLLAGILQNITTRYDNLFEAPFPYSMGFHQRPSDGRPHPEFHFHAHYYPPLLRSATVRKFMVGYEMLGTPQRDITPESAAERLVSLTDVHYLHRSGSA
jgi:UDPglucose--hexose-1-phosphate uridylyltransferase